ADRGRTRPAAAAGGAHRRGRRLRRGARGAGRRDRALEAGRRDRRRTQGDRGRRAGAAGRGDARGGGAAHRALRRPAPALPLAAAPGLRAALRRLRPSGARPGMVGRPDGGRVTVELAPNPGEIQRRASDPAASVWVGASAGTGKTKVLTDRVLRLMLAGT